jgi:hypothetical protein
LPWALAGVLALAVALAVMSRAGARSDLAAARTQISTLQGQLSAQKATSDDLTSQVSHWQSDAHHWKVTTRYWQAELHMMQDRINQSVGDLDRPSFSLWNSCGDGGPKAGCELTPGHEYVGGLPDTFTYILKFHATVPVTVHILSVHDFACFQLHACSWHGQTWEKRTSLRAVLHEAEGCAGYLAVFTSERAGRLYPDVWVTRNSATHPTGVCT